MGKNRLNLKFPKPEKILNKRKEKMYRFLERKKIKQRNKMEAEFDKAYKQFMKEERYDK